MLRGLPCKEKRKNKIQLPSNFRGSGVMMLNATFNNISVISWGQFDWWRKLEDPEKITVVASHI